MIGKTVSDHTLLESDDGKIGLTLTRIIRSTDHLHEVKKSSLSAGDWIFVKTVRSLYRLRALGGGLCEVSGGWFDKKRLLFRPIENLRLHLGWQCNQNRPDCGLRIENGIRESIDHEPHSEDFRLAAVDAELVIDLVEATLRVAPTGTISLEKNTNLFSLTEDS